MYVESSVLNRIEQIDGSDDFDLHDVLIILQFLEVCKLFSLFFRRRCVVCVLYVNFGVLIDFKIYIMQV